jgi:DNA repair protein RecO (recombination protein O)
MELTKYLGFMPSNKIDIEHFFEKIEGIFQINYTSSCLNKDESLLFNDLINATYDRPKIFTKSQRIFLTNTLLEYYQWHVEGFRLPKSLEVLKELYS